MICVALNLTAITIQLQAEVKRMLMLETLSTHRLELNPSLLAWI